MPIDTKSLEYEAMAKKWVLPNALWGDTPAMREAGKAFLPQRASESPEAYKTRLNETVLVNYFGAAIKNLTGKVFQKPIVVGENLQSKIDWFKDIDLSKSNINDFGTELFKSASRHGLTHILVDAPNDQEAETRAQQIDNNIRPYWTHVTADQLIGCKTEKVDNVDTLTGIRILESIIVDKDDYEQEKTDQIRHIFIGENGLAKYEVYRKDKHKKWNVHEEGEFGINYIPIVTFYTNRTGFMTGCTYFETLAHLNLQHWQSSSYQRNILNVARVPRPYGLGFTGDEIDAFQSHGVRNGLFSTNENAKVGWMEAAGHSIEHGERDLANLEEKMTLLSLDPVLKKAPSTEIATIANIEASKSNSVLQSWSEALQRALIEATEIMLDMSGEEIDSPDIKVNDDFSIIADVEKRVKELREMRRFGEITSETFLKEVKRIGFFDEDFDVLLEVEMLESESDPVGIGPIEDGLENNA